MSQRRDRLAARVWPLIDAYVLACGGAPDRASASAATLDRMLVGKGRKRVNIDKRALRMAIVDARGFMGPAAVQLGISRPAVFRLLRDAGLSGYAREWREKTGWRFGRPRKAA